MTVIPDGGHAEVQWGVKWEHGTEPCPSGAVHVENFSLHHSSGGDQAMARQIAGTRPQASLVAREVTYGPWLAVEASGTGDRDVPAAIGAQVVADLVREILVGVCERDGLSLESAAEPGTPARNYELALRLGIGRVFGLPDGDPA